MKSKSIIFSIMFALFIIIPGYALADNTATADADSSSTSGALIDGSAGINNSFNGPENPNVIPGEVNYPGVMNYYGKARPSAAFQDVRIALMYGVWYSEDSLKSILKGTQSTWSDFKVVNGQLDAAPADADGVRWIKIVINNSAADDKGNVYPMPLEGADIVVGQGAAEAAKKSDLMIEVIADLALDALQAGCNVLQITDQGFVDDAFGKVAGIGGQTTQLLGGELLNSSSFALGYSSSRSGSRSLPWIQAFGLIDYELGFPPDRARAYSGVTKPSYDYPNTKQIGTK